ncbi:calcium-binding protein [Nostoc sp.]|uniref:calcium-binding protein n=1 Tax=Nostoc sp. TaxID=1180 RepID=UPI003FA5FBA9
MFNGQTSITDSFDVFNANSTQSTIFNKNTVTFLNDLNNNVNGFDNSDDVINGQGGDDIIDGKSGNDLLRAGAGNNTLIGGAGDDTLSANGYDSSGDNLFFGGDGNDSLENSGSGSSTLNGGAGDDILISGYSNILIGGAGDDTLNADYSSGDNLLSGGDGNDSFDLYNSSTHLAKTPSTMALVTIPWVLTIQQAITCSLGAMAMILYLPLMPWVIIPSMVVQVTIP